MERSMEGLTASNGILIRQPKDEWGEIPLSVERQLANQVMNALALTLSETTKLCLGKKEERQPYEDTAEVLSLMLVCLNKIGLEEHRFKQNADVEKTLKTKYHEQEIYCFESGPFTIDGIKIERFRILIRPEDNVIDKSGRVQQLAQARTKISLFSSALPAGEASIRIDPPDSRHNNNVVFDLAVGTGKWVSTIDTLDLNQVAGHHFQSGISVKEFGDLNVANVHRAIVNRLMQLS